VSEASALEAVDRIVNRGGEPAEVVEAVVVALRERGFAAEAGNGAIEIAGASAEFAARVATLVSPYVARLEARRAPAPPSS
jgi:hypothetical protein